MVGIIVSFIVGLWIGCFIVILNHGGNIEKIMGKRNIEKIRIDEIKIPKNFGRIKPRRDKYNERIAYFEKTGKFYAPIILDENNILVDGYISYLIAKRYGFKEVEIKRKRK